MTESDYYDREETLKTPMERSSAYFHWLEILCEANGYQSIIWDRAKTICPKIVEEILELTERADAAFLEKFKCPNEPCLNEFFDEFAQEFLLPLRGLWLQLISKVNRA